jgi:hypothetical protein
VLVDAPRSELQVEFDVDVHFPKQNVYLRLGRISLVVRTLAKEQFDDYVKPVPIFIHPSRATAARQLPNLSAVLSAAIDDVSEAAG